MATPDPLRSYVGPDYPRWSQTLSDGRQVLISPLRRQDAAAEYAFIKALSPESKRFRFLGQIAEPDADFIESLTDIDYVNDVALAAVVKEGAKEKIVGVSRYSKDPVGDRCESAVVVADDWQDHGLGTALMKHLILIARQRGLRTMESIDLAENLRMRDLAHDLGFHVRPDPKDARQVIYSLDLDHAAAKNDV
jgi:GNAT superfamily N-acetyltransferase